MKDEASAAPRPDDPTPVAQDAPPAMGHNKPPAFDQAAVDALTKKVTDFTDAAGAGKELKEIDSEAMAGKLADYITGARKVHKDVDEARKVAKKPHDDAGKSVQAAFLPLLDKLKKSADDTKKLQTAWLVKQEKIAQDKRRKEEAEAKAKLEEAQKQAAAAEARNDISGEVDAGKAIKDAANAVKRAAAPVKVGAASASGGGRKIALRTVRSAEVTNVFQAFNHYKDHPELIALLERLATAELRSAGDDFNVPGFNVKEEKKAA